MSKKCFDYLSNSLLGNKMALENGFSQYNDEELRMELNKYREYILSNINEIHDEIQNDDKNNLSICIESFQDLPDEETYKQLLLYMDKVIIPDPIFKLTETPSELTKASSHFLGLTYANGINRKDLCDAINYVFNIEQLICSQIIIMVPVSLIHEQPEVTPILYSPTSFSDIIPKELLEYYRSIAKVYNLVPSECGLKVISEKTLEVGTRILVEFIDEDCCGKAFFQYCNAKANEKNGDASISVVPADVITENEFKFWVNQSINQASNSHFNDVYQELVLSAICGCMYLTRSNIVSNVLRKVIVKPSKTAGLVTLALSLELPITSNIPMKDLISIRQNYGQAFHNFRTSLNSKLINLNLNADSADIKHQLDSISYEMNMLQVQEVEKEYRKITRTLKIDALGFTGSLIASFINGGLTAVGAAATFAKGIIDANKYYTDVHEHNGYFLWKLNKRSQKYTP